MPFVLLAPPPIGTWPKCRVLTVNLGFVRRSDAAASRDPGQPALKSSKSSRWRVGLAAVLAVAAMQPAGAPAAERTIGIVAGSPGSDSHATASAVCAMLAADRARHGLGCRVVVAAGSVESLKLLRDFKADFALASSDVLRHAQLGQKSFAGEPVADLRVVFGLNPQPLTVLVRPGTLRTVSDLKGRRVGYGNDPVGRLAAEDYFDSLGITPGDFVKIRTAAFADPAGALCAGQIDAAVITVGHPNEAVRKATAACDARLMSLTGPYLEKTVPQRPDLNLVTIPGGTYANNRQSVVTFGAQTVLVARASTPGDLVYTVARAVVDDVGAFRMAHPVLGGLTSAAMAANAVGAPLHDGARRCFAERGLR